MDYKEKFQCLLTDLSYFVCKLNELILHQDPPRHELVAREMVEHDMSQLGELRVTRLVYDASSDGPDSFAEPASKRLEELTQARILGYIWFRTMDDRKEAVAPAHHDMFAWALNPPWDMGEVEWDNFPEWLRSGS
jgi:hypothetical protein